MEGEAFMARKLWTVLADHQPVAVIAANHSHEAVTIAAALTEHADLPPGQEITPCPRRQASRTLALARELGCAHSFLACIKGGMFLTFIGDLPQGTA
jgi:hypothetical protein